MVYKQISFAVYSKPILFMVSISECKIYDKEIYEVFSYTIIVGLVIDYFHFYQLMINGIYSEVKKIIDHGVIA